MGKYDKMSLDQIEQERNKMAAEMAELEKAHGEYRGRRLKELKAEVEEMLAKEGFTLADLGLGRGSQKASAGKSKGVPKYRHPGDSSMTWSGRGRQPSWYKEAIAAGMKPEDMLV